MSEISTLGLDIDTLYKIIVPKRWTVGQSDDEKRDWHNLRHNPEVERFYQDFMQGKKRFFLVPAGRRGFKTETGIHLTFWYAANNAGVNLIIAGPTVENTRQMVWESLKGLAPVWALKRPNGISEGDLSIQLLNGSKIRVMGLNEPARLRGSRLNGVMIDEAGYIDEHAQDDEIFRSHIKPGLNDTKGWCILAGTPNGCRKEFYQLHTLVTSDPEKFSEYGIYHWTTADVRGEEFVASDRLVMSKEKFKQENEGLFVHGSGAAYIFNRDVHVSKEKLPLNLRLPVDISCDFNVNIMPWVVCQYTPDMTFVLDEVVGRNCSIEHMCNLTKARLVQMLGNRAKMHQIRFFGDASAQSIRDPAASKAGWTMIRDNFADWNVELKLTKRNPPIGDRREIVNARLETADGKVHCQIGPTVKELVQDFETISYADIMSGEKTQSGEERSHSSDAFGYYSWYQYKSNYQATGVQTYPI